MLMHCVYTCRVFRVKLPKTFLAVNLSDAFTFQEKPQNGEGEGETEADGDVLEMKGSEHEHRPTSTAPPQPAEEQH
jgi:inositol hexakisphosphate/diphosphoinositol-pentakisphosphate kinase